MSIPPLEMRHILSNTERELKPGEAPSSHPVTKMKIAGSDSVWYSKKITFLGPENKWHEEQDSRVECLAQEFFRLIIPHQPEVRLLTDTSTKPPAFYILSEEVKGFHDLPHGESAHFADGRYTGLGQATTLAMFLEEVDLKNGNIGLDEHGRVIKIDGDWCFAGLRLGSQRVPQIEYKLTEKAIASLPFSEDFYAFNWMDQIMGDVLIASPKNPIVERGLAKTKSFIDERNQAVLKLCLLPDEYIDRFVLAFLPDKGQRFAGDTALYSECGFIKMSRANLTDALTDASINPATCPFEKIAAQLRGKDSIIVFENQYYYVDQAKHAVTPIAPHIATMQQFFRFQLLSSRCTDAYQRLTEADINLIKEIMGHAPPKEPVLPLNDLLKSRREELKASALQNDSFQEYLATPAAIADTEELVTQLLYFRSNGVPVEATPEDVAHIRSSFQGLLEKATPQSVLASTEAVSISTPSSSPAPPERPMKILKTDKGFFAPSKPSTPGIPGGSPEAFAGDVDEESTHLKPGEPT